jgi:hypothetical protein
MTHLIEAKFLQLTPRRGDWSLTYEFDQENQSERQQLRIWREGVQDCRCSLVLKNATYEGNYRFYTFHGDFNDDYTSADFWFTTWPVIANGLNAALSDSGEDFEFEVHPLELPSWAIGDTTAIPLPSDLLDVDD